MQELIPLVFDIHRFALDDGPGIRTTIFLKGCPLSCSWCHNPESMSVAKETAFDPGRCIRCGSCRDICPEAAIAEGLPRQINLPPCTTCGRCAEICPTMAIRMIGKEYPVNDLLEIILRDRHFFQASGGGVTFSGGEPTLWPDYLSAALRALKAKGLHTAIQTCGIFDYERIYRKVLPFTDLIMFDIKCIDGAKHKIFTGRDNTSLLQNFKNLAKMAGDRLLPRVPLVPGVTATRNNLLDIALFLRDLGLQRCDLLPYNPAGIEKRRAMGMELPPEELQGIPFSRDEEEELRRFFFDTLHNLSNLRPEAGNYPDAPQGGRPCRSTFTMQ
jgi:pyruvate formate lyase activating enzyme